MIRTQLHQDQEELWLPTVVAGKSCNAIVDLGSARTIVDEDLVKELNLEMQPTELMMIGADRRQGKQPFLGKLVVEIRTSGNSITAEVLVAMLNDAPMLIGRDIASQLGILAKIPLERLDRSPTVQVDDVSETVCQIVDPNANS